MFHLRQNSSLARAIHRHRLAFTDQPMCCDAMLRRASLIGRKAPASSERPAIVVLRPTPGRAREQESEEEGL